MFHNIRAKLDGWERKEKIIKDYLQNIKSILEEDDQLNCGNEIEENRKNKRDPSEKKENNVNTTPFTSQKVVPIVLEENELKR